MNKIRYGPVAIKQKEAEIWAEQPDLQPVHG